MVYPRFINRAAAGVRGLWFTLGLLTARPWAERDSCFTRGFFFNRAAMGRARFMVLPWFIFRCFVGDQTQTSTRPNRQRDESRNLWCLVAKYYEYSTLYLVQNILPFWTILKWKKKMTSAGYKRHKKENSKTSSVKPIILITSWRFARKTKIQLKLWIISALVASNWSQITFFIFAHVLTSISGRFFPNLNQMKIPPRPGSIISACIFN